MIAVRISKAFLVLLISLFCPLVSYNNIVDYGSNFAFVQHVMSMDTTFPGNRLMGRALTSPFLHHAAYWLIIAGELVAGVLCFVGSLTLFRSVRRERAVFSRSRTWAIAGLTLGLFVWFFGFMTVAAEWFLMWQSPQWNAAPAASRFIMCLGIVLLYVSHPEDDI